ncbi:hypothetical protein Syun_005824 [Stephania yunnanensis]|uniref:Uncharacterized protein n=1 Tax=Stephania yunnanensis TaxID=152371 RepID=A0AAP0KWY3_9MAGN
MARLSCSTGDGSSSPVPLIGLYIAGATATCFLLMLCDVISSVRSKTGYIPCKWFSLSSATITLLAIASKLPVDLTTYMPRASDQLSKLTGTTMISTGVIFLFIAEHIIILCCMMMLLTVLWPYTIVLNKGKTLINETMRNVFQNGKASSLQHQAKRWYMSSCISNPQYFLRGGDYGLTVAWMICFLCLTILSQASLRWLVHKFEICEEPIMQALKEAFEIVYYVDEKNVHLSKNDSSAAHLDSSVNEALSSITNEMKAFPDGLAKREMEIVRDFVHGQKYASIEELHKDLEQLFVDIYIPCKWFSLNSTTLTLLAIASKLPVDLTTYMPSAVLSQAALRLLIHKFEICDGTSDYGWSISIILITQTSTIVVISISTAFRWIVIVSDPPFHWNSAATEFDFDMHFEVEIFSFLSLVYNRELRKSSILFSLYLLLKGVVVIMTLLILYVLAAPVFVIRLICIKIIRIFHAYCPASSTSSSTVVVLEKWKTELREVFHPTKRFPKWIMRSRVEDMNKWINLSNRSPPNYLVQLLSRPHAHPPQTLSNKLQQIGAAKGYYKLSCLSVVILAKIVALSIPFHLAKTLMQAVDEAFEIAYYIDKKINVGNFQDGMKRRFAKVLLAHKNVHLSKNDSSTRTNMSVDEALSSIENECKAFPNGLAKQEMEIMRHFIDSQDYASIGELYEHLEQLFVDMLTGYLPCKLFSINSLTLTLLATASKLPVDLTTYMPGARDQLSKLSSTAMRMTWICVEDLKKWMDASNRSPPAHLVQLLSEPHFHHPQTLVDMVQQIGIRSYSEGYRLSCLSVVILTRIASLSISSTLSKTLMQVLDEAEEIIYCIDKKINVGKSEDHRKRQFAKVLWAYKGVHLSKIDSNHSNWSVSEAISSIKNECLLFPKGLAAREMDIITSFILIREREYTSIEELYNHLKQLFIDIRTRYLPCKLFSINSVTLTLLATASKLPVDLTTYMPGARDQLSKLSSTAMVCVCIGFLVPSIGINREAESITNLIALSLLVTTIVVNVCIQMYTGVIFTFFPGHIIILCCMMLLLSVLWFFTSEINRGKTVIADTNRNLFRKGQAKSFLHQVKLWYMSSCISNPQYLLCGHTGLMAAMISIVCLTVLSHAAFQTLPHKSKYCTNASDYGWSISFIVVTQIITVVVGSLGIIFRSISMVSSHTQGYLTNTSSHIVEIEMFALKFLAKKSQLLRAVSIIMMSRFVVKIAVTIINLLGLMILGLIPVLAGLILLVTTLLLLSLCCPKCLITNPDISQITLPWKEELKDHVSRVIDTFPERIMWICVEDMKKWMNVSNKSPPTHLAQLLSEPRFYRPQTLVDMVQQIGITSFSEGYRLSCLSVVNLARISTLSIPSTLSKTLMQVLDEAYEIIYYIDKKINVGNSEDHRKRQFAKVLWAYKGVHLSKIDPNRSNWSVAEAISSIKNEWLLFPKGLAAREMDIITAFILIREREYASIEELYHHLEQLFIDMLLFFLSQLPIAILKEVNESPIEVHEEKARFALKLLSKLKLLEDKVQWSFPQGYHVTRLMDPEEENDNQTRQAEIPNFTPVDQDPGASTIQTSNIHTPDVEMG